MKKLNVKKVNQFFMTLNNSTQLKNLVELAITDFNTSDVPNVKSIVLLQDLGLLVDQN